MNWVDAHQHFWNPARGDYPWLLPSATTLYREFGPTMLEPLLEAAHVRRTVLIQAAPSEAETRYLLSIAADHAFVGGVVGWVDFAAPDVGERIARLVGEAQGKLKGLRPMIQDIPDPCWLGYRHLDRAFDAMIAHGLTFDALVTPEHLSLLRDRLLRYPQLKAVLDHAGKPDIVNDRFDDWAAAIDALARDTSLHCKLSGLLTLAGTCGADTLERYIGHVFACFGTRRIIWGSDWPMVTLSSSYERWFAIAREWARRVAPGSEAAVFGANAVRFYGLDGSTRDHTASPPEDGVTHNRRGVLP